MLTILELYRRVYEDLLAIPVILGTKTEKEKFAGGDYTTTAEAFVSASGRGIQGATSHHLGQNFARMFDIGFQDPIDPKIRSLVYQNSWGLTTRTIGVLIMIHGDSKGLVLPPEVADVQVVVIPCGMSSDKSQELNTYCEQFVEVLKGAGVRGRADLRGHYSPGWKYNHWEMKGVPIRVDIGPAEMGSKKFVTVSRLSGEKLEHSLETAGETVRLMLSEIQEQMFTRARTQLTSHVKVIQDWDEFLPLLDKKNLVMSPFCLETPCEDRIKADTSSGEVEPGAPAMGAKSLCIPFDQPGDATILNCIHPKCGKKAKSYTLFGRSY